MGFPLHSTIKGHNFNHILDKLNVKLVGWKAKYLSLAGRKVLAKSVLESIPTHILQCTYILVKMCNKIDAIVRNFLWGFTRENRKMHLVGWDKVLKFVLEGGLGLHKCYARNLTLLTKLN